MNENDIFKFDAPNNYDFIKNIKQENSKTKINSKNDSWFFVEHFLHFSKKQNPKKKKFRKNRSCSITIKASLKPKETKLLSKLTNLIEIEEKPKKTTIKKKLKLRRKKFSSSFNYLPKKNLRRKKTILLKKKNNLEKEIKKKKVEKRNFLERERNKRKKILEEKKIKIKIKKKFEILKEKSKNKKNKKSTVFFYEPQIYNKSITKSYEEIKGVKWYQLDMRERKLANREIEKFLKDKIIEC